MTLRDVEKKILALLSDGQPHTKEEIHTCLWDECGSVNNVYQHISVLRKKLRPIGQDIVCTTRGNRYRNQYQHVILLRSPVAE